MVCKILFANITLVGMGVIMTCFALNKFRRDLTKVEVKLNFMEVREQNRTEEVIQYRHELFKAFDEIRHRR